VNDATVELDRIVEERRWSWRLIGWVAVLVLANRMADTVITTPQMVTTQMLEYFGTHQAAWLNSSALLAGAICSPLLAKSADIFGKRRVLLITIFVSGVGSVVCLIAPNLGIFLLGRLLQGSAMAVVFLTVAITRQLCPPRVAMTAIGIVTSASAIIGIVEPFVMEPLIAQFGFHSVFAVSVALAATAALSVGVFIPETPILGGGRIDVGGALLLGGGLAGVLGYASLAQDLGWPAPARTPCCSPRPRPASCSAAFSPDGSPRGSAPRGPSWAVSRSGRWEPSRCWRGCRRSR
jgi:MFS family permease